MKIVHVDFISVVSFGGSLKSVTSRGVVGDRPGQKAADIELLEGDILKITREVNGITRSKYVPMTNVASFEVEEVKAAPAVKPEEKKK